MSQDFSVEKVTPARAGLGNAEHFLLGGFQQFVAGAALGHETAGWIAALGDTAGESANGAAPFSVGDPVAVVSPTSCGACDACREGAESRCPNGHTGRGYGRDGGLAEYVLVDSARALVPLGV